MKRRDPKNRSISPVRTKPTSPIRLQKHTFPIQQVKKMIGKKLLIIHPGCVISNKDKEDGKAIKEKFPEEKNKKKSLVLFAMYNQGIWQIYKNIYIFLAIGSISYKEMENADIKVVINEHPKISRSELKKIL